MLEGLEDIEWGQLTHAYGQANGIPARIRELRSSDPAEWVPAMSDLYDALCHQMCSIYPATVPAIPFLVELLGDREVRCRGRILEFLGNVAFIANHNSDDDDAQEALDHQTHQAIWRGVETYLELLADLDQRVRVVVPYLLGAMVGGDVPEGESIAKIASQLQTQFHEEPNELVSTSLVFGLSCLSRHDSRITHWLEERVSDLNSNDPVRMAAALNLAERATSVSAAVMEVLMHGLDNPDETDQLFKSDHPKMESRHHPIGRAMQAFLGELSEVDDEGRDEDMKFPWCDRWQSGWVTFRILEVLSKLKVETADRNVQALLPYLDRANEYTGDSLIPPILRFVFGSRKLSPDTSREELSPAERAVLLHLFNNLKLWATNMHQQMFDDTGLGNRRTDWARVLRADAAFSEEQILEILRQKMKDEKYSEPEDVQEIRLCRIGAIEFVPHLRGYTNLKILDFADTSFADDDLEQLADFGQLRLLRLNNTPVTDAGIEYLVALSNLEELYLPGTNVTDACLETLGSLPKLKYISLSNTAVTDAGARQFMEQHPTCRISR